MVEAREVGEGWPVREMSSERLFMWFLYSSEPVGVVVVVVSCSPSISVLNVLRHDVSDGDIGKVEGGLCRNGSSVGGSRIVVVVVVFDCVILLCVCVCVCLNLGNKSN